MPFRGCVPFETLRPDFRDLVSFMETEPLIYIWGLKPAERFIWQMLSLICFLLKWQAAVMQRRLMSRNLIMA
ncbi:hypothetical protein J2T09_004652 [Neorhizobium huautlense]|uniref:Transposase n=1 Tax=Neorhizobium huautlense TaxID=67774 RepID=A0ABT9PZK5_9HYPH|nr:hypothetical protein [Neorhizobium huautlense]MDP9839872.1 hypothetical protein [Neorhizobium huautlense]